MASAIELLKLSLLEEETTISKPAYSLSTSYCCPSQINLLLYSSTFWHSILILSSPHPTEKNTIFLCFSSISFAAFESTIYPFIGSSLATIPITMPP